MKLYTSKHSAVVAMIQKQLLSPGTNITEISLQTNIGRQQIYRWLNGSATKIHDKSLYAVADAFNLKIVKTPQGIQIDHMQQKEEKTMHAIQNRKYINVLEEANQYQKEKIKNQKEEIDRLNTILISYKKKKNKPAFHFKTKCEYDPSTKSFSNNIVTGDTSMTGYTEQELSRFTSEEWALKYHHDSLEILLASIPDDIPDYTHNMWKHILWKAKDGSYRMYNIESYHDKTEGIVRSYYYWVNGDIEGKS
tara:strand:- start:10382 stop:11131 length:750 start_codon:yes stop_codon:yes gene_type:complete